MTRHTNPNEAYRTRKIEYEHEHDQAQTAEEALRDTTDDRTDDYFRTRDDRQ